MTEDMSGAEHGEALVERVVDTVRADPGRLVLDYNPWAGPWVDGDADPMPAEVLATAAFPSGRPLPPSLRRWLAFDTGMLRRSGWFDAGYTFTPRSIGQLARDEYGDGFGSIYDNPALVDRFDECFLLPGGSDSRRVLATGVAGEHGEYPVFALDVDDLPCIELMYPGFDVYLADTAGLLDDEHRVGYSALAADRRYGPRMREHARNVFAGGLAEDFTSW
ncbi:hypothetical protein GCM10010399_65130 [Dactylosporangium fulvum]|uniref:Knr4/Smi1-like domain-containing protein n=1 Tax=Dactylosporangium fulvum TaxID=53359 RepID=A0ABY5VNK8_9ACTN|nr:hypothetical protein [Dactylosporangium fulvum]UWP78870.1 hypothetical protein Dfulv_27270 [Dactylosporangium fulvum]